MPIPSASASNTAHRALQLLSIVATALAVVSCNNDLPLTPVTVASTTDALRAYRAAAFTLDVSLRDGGVSVSQPLSDARSFGVGAIPLTEGTTVQRSLSLLGAGAVDIVPSNFSAGAIGALVPGRILITFDLTIVNRLGGIRLVTSTFPAPPAGATGVQAFALEIFAIQSSSTNGTFVLSPPVTGPVIISDDWDGAPHNFLNDATCNGSVTSDCFRYKSFGPIEPLGASLPRRVGFLVVPTVSQYRVNVLVAADLLATSLAASRR